MNKVFNVQSVVIAILLMALASLANINNQLLDHNEKLTNQVSLLNAKLNKITVSTSHIKQRITELENKFEPKFKDLLAVKK